MGGLFSRPKPEPPTRMPDPESPEVRRRQQMQRQQVAARSGRTSTILSRNQSAADGTTAYRNSLLGQAG